MAMIDGREHVATALFPDNTALVRACQNGDALAWSEIVDRYERLVYAIPLREGLNLNEAADVAQETFTTLSTSLHKIGSPERLGYWLMTVARRLSWRERNRKRAAQVDVDDFGLPDPRNLSDEWATVEWVYNAL